MSKACRLMVQVGALLVLAAGITVSAGEGVAAVRLPDAVAKAFESQFPNAEISKAEMEKEDGVEVYDFEFKDGANKRECDMAADGTILNTAIVVEPKSVPEAAMKAIEKASAEGAIKRFEKSEVFAEPKAGRIVYLDTTRIEFEAEFEKGGRRGEVVVTADGEVIEGPKWTKEGEEDD